MDRYTVKSQIFWYNISMLQYREKTESCLQMFLSQDDALPVKQKQSFAESFKSLPNSVSYIYDESFISTSSHYSDKKWLRAKVRTVIH